MRADLLRAAAGRPVLATPVMSEAETVAMAPAGGRGGYPAPTAGPQTGQMARVGDPRQRKASSWLIATFSAVGVLAVIALVAALLWSQQQGKANKSVPTLVGKDQAAAVAAIRGAELQPQVGDPVLANDCTKNTVAKQNPEPGTRLKQASTVTIQLCGGKPDVKIPAGLINSQLENVKPQLENLGLVVQDKSVDNPAAKGTVLKVTPPSGTTVPQDSKVIVEVSRGNVNKVPNVVNSTRDEAAQELREAGYKVEFRDGDEVPADQAGRVQKQSPNAGTELAKDKTVTIEIGIPEKVVDPTPTVTPSGTPTATPTTPGNGGGVGLPFPPPPGRLPEN